MRRVPARGLYDGRATEPKGVGWGVASSSVIPALLQGRDQRPAFCTMLKDAVRRRYDILLVCSIDRLGQSVLHVVNALAELDAAGIRLH